jgi:translation initiation factor IF-2
LGYACYPFSDAIHNNIKEFTRRDKRSHLINNTFVRKFSEISKQKRPTIGGSEVVEEVNVSLFLISTLVEEQVGNEADFIVSSHSSSKMKKVLANYKECGVMIPIDIKNFLFFSRDFID